MNEWLLEHPLYPTVLLAAIGAFLLWRALSERSRRPLAFGVGFLLAAAAAFVTGSVVITPGEHAARTTRALVACAEAADIDGAMALFTDDAVLNYGTREAPSVSIRDIRAALDTLRGQNRIESNRITQLDFTTLDGSTGEVELSCSTAVPRADGAIPTRWIVRVRRDGDHWKIDRLTFRALFGRPPMPGVWR
jgi:ketosteroid isomerase-like protein